MKYLLMLLIVGCIACNGSESTTNTTGSDSAAIADSTAKAEAMQPRPDTISLSGSWFLLPVLPADTGAGRTPQLNIDLNEKKFTGNTGCNSMSGNFDYTDTSLVFNERIMMTKMACPGYNEAAFMKNLLRTQRFRFEDSVLILMIGETELSRWSRTPAKPPVSNKL